MQHLQRDMVRASPTLFSFCRFTTSFPYLGLANLCDTLALWFTPAGRAYHDTKRQSGTALRQGDLTLLDRQPLAQRLVCSITYQGNEYGEISE